MVPFFINDYHQHYAVFISKQDAHIALVVRTHAAHMHVINIHHLMCVRNVIFKKTNLIIHKSVTITAEEVRNLKAHE